MRKITPAFITLLILGIVGLLIAVYIGRSMMPKPVVKEPIGTRTVPMPAADIPAGTLLTKDHIVLGFLSKDKQTPDTIINKDVVIGRYALKDLKQAKPIHTSDLYAPGVRPPFKVAPGMRAVTIGLGDSSAVVDGLIKPGDYVDVHLTVDNNSSDRRYRGGFTMTMFKGVKVLAMNRLTQQSTLNRGTNTVTFELTPAQANILLQAKTKGALSVTYTPNGPGSGGVAVAEADRAYFEEILGLPEIPKPKKPFTTEIYRGSSRSVIRYDDEDDYYDGRNYDYNRNNRATPWIEQPGWAPPRTGGGGYGGYGRGYWGGYRGGYRGTQNEYVPQGQPGQQGQPLQQPQQPQQSHNRTRSRRAV